VENRKRIRVYYDEVTTDPRYEDMRPCPARIPGHDGCPHGTPYSRGR
jgi:hypothetical protein